MTPHHHLSRRALLLGGVASVLGGAGALRAGGVGAADASMRLESAAAVTQRARRLSLEPKLDTGPLTPNEHGLIFPMGPEPRCNVLTNFGDGRSGGRSHQGIDILATQGQDIYAVADGVITDVVFDGDSNSSLSGNLLDLTLPDGTYYVYAHLSGFAPGIERGLSVRQGDVIGYVGDTGNPGEGNYHLHFEVHPDGGSAIDPMRVLTIPSVCNVW